MPESPQFKAPTGTRDVMVPEAARWERLVSRFASHLEAAGYGLVLGPMFEDVGVFVRGMGESTDVVRKEMYDFHDKGGRHLALRPEGTASVVRCFVQHRPPPVWKAWYVTPAFRYERPQAGRLRQHHQLGAEALGSPDPDLDVEVVGLACRFLAGLGLERFSLRLGSMGDAACRPAYVDELSAWLAARAQELCPEHRRRLGANPLRVLDCKKPQCVSATAGAPKLLERLCDACRAHLDRVIDGLEALGQPFELDPRLVRGLDYYTRTTFELAGLALEGAQNALGGGGRYDGLVEALGGPPTPGIGFSMGVERLLLACDAEGVLAEEACGVDVFVVDLVGGGAARDLTFELRQAGIGADRAYDARTMRAQMRAAGRSGARVAAIVGPEEAAAGKVSLRPLAGEGDQQLVDRDSVAEALRRWLG
ncbi:MAG TPA: histidine--tRNA ligase [Acidimicrobiales bacterium]|nr:histidine--tRNA ligase [Acidimicrobiales bacterium]